MKVAEIEYKKEITGNELISLPKKLKQLGFKFNGKQTIHDVYVSREKSPFGGWNFCRLRNESDNKYFETIKNWELPDGTSDKIRIEKEREITHDEYEEKRVNPVVEFTKTRNVYVGKLGNRDCHIDIDVLELNRKRCFFEVEVIDAPENSTTIRKEIIRWVEETFNFSIHGEAPSQLDIVLGD